MTIMPTTKVYACDKGVYCFYCMGKDNCGNYTVKPEDRGNNMHKEDFYELMGNDDFTETECPQCELIIIHHKDHQLQFCGMCDYEFEEVEDE